MSMKHLALAAVSAAIVIFTVIFATTAIAGIDTSGVSGTEMESVWTQSVTLGSISMNVLTFIPILICIGGLVAALAYFKITNGKGKKGKRHH